MFSAPSPKPTVGLLRSLDGDACWICGEAIAEGQFSIDHIAPRSHNGPDILSNTRLAHRSPCNVRRGAPVPSASDFPLHRLHPADRTRMAKVFRHYVKWWRMLGPVPMEILLFIAPD